MDRQEYLEQMQTLREKQQENARINRESLDKLNDSYREQVEMIAKIHREQVRHQRDIHSANQYEIEREMNDLKKAWCAEHPHQEVQVIE